MADHEPQADSKNYVDALRLLASVNDEMAPNYDRLSVEGDWDTPKRIADKLVSYLPDSGQILDLGVGTGSLQRALALSEYWQISGIDISQGMVEIARTAYPEADMQQGLIQDFTTTFPDKKFDVIASTGALEFVPDLDDIVMKMATSLNTGGMLAFSFEVREPGEANWRNYLATTASQSGEFTVYRRSKEEVERSIANSGLVVVDYDEYDGYERDSQPVPYGLVIASKNH
jgi:predicted TPR repeat methyltransferase